MDPPASARPAAIWLRLAAPMVVGLGVLLTFVPAMEAQFVNWDDNYVIMQNPAYRGFSREHLRWMFTSLEFGHYQPLTWLSYALDDYLYRNNVWPLETFGYHATSVLLHAISAVLFYFVARTLLAAAFRQPEARTSAPFVCGGLIAAVLFSVHPLRAESVAWVSERRDVLAMVFYLATVAVYLGHARSGRRIWFALALVAYGLSLLAKASGVVLPLVLLVLDVYPLRRWPRRGAPEGLSEVDGSPLSAASRPLGARGGWRLLAGKAPFALMAAAAAVAALAAQRETGALHTLAEHDLVARLSQSCYGLMFYLGKTVAPWNLSPIYQMPPRHELVSAFLPRSAALVGVLTAAAVWARRRQPFWLAAWGIYVLTLLPVLGIAQSGPQWVADRYSYFSCLPWAVLAAAGPVWVYRRRLVSGVSRLWKPLTTMGMAALAAVLVRATFAQADVWQWSISLWAHAVEVSPNSSIAYANYADAIAEAAIAMGDRDRVRYSTFYYKKALELDPQDVIARSHRARVLALLGEDVDAELDYRRALTINPARDGLHLEFARFLMQRDRTMEAVYVLKEGARFHPGNIPMIFYLAEILATHPDDSVRSGAEAVRYATHVNNARRGLDAAAWAVLAAAYRESGRRDDAATAAGRGREVAARNADDRAVEHFDQFLQRLAEAPPVVERAESSP